MNLHQANADRIPGGDPYQNENALRLRDNPIAPGLEKQMHLSVSNPQNDRAAFAPALTAAAFALLAFLAPSHAQDAASALQDTAAEPAPTLEDLDGKIRLLERKLEVKEEEEEKKKTENATVTAGKDGFSIISADKESVLKFRFFQHADGRAFIEEMNETRLANTLLIRRVRPIWEGTLAKYYNFRIMPELSGTPLILDAYAEIAYWPEARLRVGRSKTPFGLERLKSSTDMDFIEFAHPTSLTPNYDLGISLLGDFANDAYSYYVGVFNGAVDGTNRDTDINDEKDLIGRVFALPFKNGTVEPLRGLGIGFAASYGHRQGDSVTTELPAYRTEGQQSFYASRVVATRAAAGATAAVSADTGTVRANGDLIRINPQAYWYWGSFGLFGEYVSSTQAVGKGGSKANVKANLTAEAWNATVSYLVTGESPSFKGLKPRHSVGFGEGGGFGAVELLARASQLKADADAFPRFVNPNSAAKEAFTWSGGLTWYLSRYVKLSVEYAWTEFKGGAAAGADRVEEKVFFGRLQTVF